MQAVKNGTAAFRSYSYDGMEMLKSDGGVKGISYNLLNLPQSATTCGKTLATYIYDAAGSKLRNTGSDVTWDYINGIVYNNNSIQFIQTDEDRAEYNGSTFLYQYYLKDHLSNTRVTLTKNTDGTAKNIQENEYYSFGLAATAPSTPSPPTPYNYGFDNPIRFTDPDGMGPTDWVMGKDKDIHWDPKANSQSTTKAGENYLGKDLKFKFNRAIEAKNWDGPTGDFPVGDKLTSTISLTSNEDKDGNLLSVNVKSDYKIGSTDGIFKGDNTFPGLGADQNKSVNITGSSGFNATFEQHASVNGFEAFGMKLMGFSVVNVAQKMNIGLSGNNLSISAGTDVSLQRVYL